VATADVNGDGRDDVVIGTLTNVRPTSAAVGEDVVVAASLRHCGEEVTGRNGLKMSRIKAACVSDFAGKSPRGLIDAALVWPPRCLRVRKSS
jgi:hypothetical protein